MGRERASANDRLKELMKLKGITIKDLAELLHVAEKTVTADANGNRTFQPDRAIQIAETYHVSLDWLYGVSDYMNTYDMMADLILALDKVFRVVIRHTVRTEGGNTYDLSEPALYINKALLSYLNDIRELQDYIDHSGQSKEEYQRHRAEIQARHKANIQEIFGIGSFSEERFIEIKRVEEAPDHPTFLDFLR